MSRRTSSRWLHSGSTAETWWPLYVNTSKKGNRMLLRQKRKEKGTSGVEGKAEEKKKKGEEEEEERTHAGPDGCFLKEL